MDAYQLRPAVPTDYDFLYDVQRETMRTYVEQTFGPWDETFQRELFDSEFDPAQFQVIVVDGVDAGLLLLETYETHWFLDKIYLLPAYQNRGIGRRLLESIIERARRAQMPIKLRVLKVNPAQRLYRRLGFRVIEEHDVRYVMQLDPA